jgi:hypothetical protein
VYIYTLHGAICIELMEVSSRCVLQYYIFNLTSCRPVIRDIMNSVFNAVPWVVTPCSLPDWKPQFSCNAITIQVLCVMYCVSSIAFDYSSFHTGKPV